LLEELAGRARHGLVWVYGNRDYFGDFDADLGVGVEVPDDGRVTVGGQRFTNSLDHVEDDVVLVTHVETWRLADHFEGRAHFCGNTHLGRVKGRRVNSAFLQYTPRGTDERKYGGYVVLDLDEDGPLDVEVREIGSLDEFECEAHGERGRQFHDAFEECMYCAEPEILDREMAASAFYGLTRDAEEDAVGAEELVDYAVELWDDPPENFRQAFASYVERVDEDRYAPLTRRDDGRLAVAEESYAY
jgi:hypothetical protein